MLSVHSSSCKSILLREDNQGEGQLTIMERSLAFTILEERQRLDFRGVGNAVWLEVNARSKCPFKINKVNHRNILID